MSGSRVTNFAPVGAVLGTGGSGGSVGTPAGGDLEGTYPAPTVTAIQGTPVSPVPPTTGQVPTFDGTEYVPTTPAAGAPSGPAGGDLTGAYPNPSVAKVNGVAVTGSAAAGRYIRASGPAAAGWDAIHAPDYPFHDEPLTDGASNFIFAGGDVVVVTGVPN